MCCHDCLHSWHCIVKHRVKTQQIQHSCQCKQHGVKTFPCVSKQSMYVKASLWLCDATLTTPARLWMQQHWPCPQCYPSWCSCAQTVSSCLSWIVGWKHSQPWAFCPCNSNSQLNHSYPIKNKGKTGYDEVLAERLAISEIFLGCSSRARNNISSAWYSLSK